MNELLMVVDKNRNQLGVKDRAEVHRDGDWHETFQCWFVEVIDDALYIYLQLRSESKKDFPTMYDITAAGHLLWNETVEDGVREIKEELGIDVKYDELKFLGAIPNSITLPGFIDNEISLVYLYEVRGPVTFCFEDQEVSAVIKVRMSDFTDLIVGKIECIDLIHVAGKRKDDNVMSLSEVVPHEKIYFAQVLAAIEKNFSIEESIE